MNGSLSHVSAALIEYFNATTTSTTKKKTNNNALLQETI